MFSSKTGYYNIVNSTGKLDFLGYKEIKISQNVFAKKETTSIDLFL